MTEDKLMNDNQPLLERCDCEVIHEAVVNRVQSKMPAEEMLYDLAELFKVFGDSTRIKILWALDSSGF
jgi:hypothetical protein